MKIYMTDIELLEPEQIFAQMLSFVTEERKSKISHFRKYGDQCRSLAAGLLLEYGLREHGLSLLPGTVQQVRLTCGKNSKPALDGDFGIHFNLSHSGRYVAGVFSDSEAGIDVEQIREGQMKVAKRFFTPEEYLMLQKQKPEETDRCFTELWTRKESYIKAVGSGMALDLASFRVLGDRVETPKTEEQEVWYLRSYAPVDGYVLSVCTKDPAECEIRWIGREMFVQKFI